MTITSSACAATSNVSMWRNDRFPQITRTLFMRILKDLDSQLEDVSQCEPSLEHGTETDDQRDLPTCEAGVKTTDVNVAPNGDVAPKSDVADSGSVLSSRNVEERNATVHEKPTIDQGDVYGPAQKENHLQNPTDNADSMNKSPEFTAENITRLYMQSRGIANTLGLELSAKLDGNAANQELSGVNNETTQEHVHKIDKALSNERRMLTSQRQTTYNIDTNEPPAFTSTPIISRQEEQTSHGLASQAIRAIFNRIEQLECGIKAIKKDILHQMESRLDDLKSSVVEMIEKIDSNRTYANVTKDSSSIQFIGQAPPENQLNMSASSNVDEGYGGQSSLNIIRSSSETQLKTSFNLNQVPLPSDHLASVQKMTAHSEELFLLQRTATFKINRGPFPHHSRYQFALPTEISIWILYLRRRSNNVIFQIRQTRLTPLLWEILFSKGSIGKV